MYCKTCGTEMNENQVICLKCGCTKGTGTKYCANCGNELLPNAFACLNCGVAANYGVQGKKETLNVENDWCPADKDKIIVLLLTFFLGGFGFHNFYLGEMRKGLLRLCTCWFFLGSVLAFIDFIKMLTGSYVVNYDKLI